MSDVFEGRYTAQTEDPFLLFIIGMSINKPLAIRQWWPVFTAMPPMMDELRQNPDLGMMEGRLYLSWPVIMSVQVWRSFDHLEAYARATEARHLPAWKRFNQRVGKSGIVGIFHETYLIQAGNYEAVYVNMPKYGLGKAFHHAPATGRWETARRRLGGESEPAVESDYSLN